MEKKFKNALVLGKFYPPHNGHLYLIDSAFEQSETVHVLMCSLKSETIPGEDRFKWLSKIYENNPNINIIHCDDELPQYPEEDPDFWGIWYRTVYKYIKKLDAVFTSEDYGEPFANVLNIEHVLVDKKRLVVPVSGTLIRNCPFDHWEHIPRVARDNFKKKVVIMGAESTGKTTMVKTLAKHYNSKYVMEYGRTYTEAMDDINELNSFDMLQIALLHRDIVNRYDPDATKLLIVDTEAITTKVFGKIYVDKDFDSDGINDIIKAQDYDLYFLLENDVPYVNDGTRLPEEVRVYSNRLLKEELDKWGIKYISISGNYDERFKKIKRHIKKEFLL